MKKSVKVKMNRRHRLASTYERQKKDELSQQSLILMAYDKALDFAGKKEWEKVREVVGILKQGLNFSKDPAFASAIYTYYSHLEHIIDKEDDKSSLLILLQYMRDNWAQAFKQVNKPRLDGFKPPQLSDKPISRA